MTRLAYLDCMCGIAGDMTLAACIDAGANAEAIQAAIGSLGLPDVKLVVEETRRRGFRAKHVTIEHPPEHAHRHLHHIEAMIERGDLTDRARANAMAIFRRLGEAEAKVHGTTLAKVHFHEVGAVDSIADVVGAAVALDLLGVEQVFASPIPTGAGEIEIAHGRVSVPAPATAELLRGAPVTYGGVDAELTTPTGAAIVVTLAAGFGPAPPMKLETIGWGAGTKDFEARANVLRILLGESDDAAARDEELWLLETNIDDASGETVGHCLEQLLAAGALDAFAAPIQMKKGRPGVQVGVLCDDADVESLLGVLFRETTTFGVRRTRVLRRALARVHSAVETPWGQVSGMFTEFEGRRRFSPEFASCRALGEKAGVPFRDVYAAAVRSSAT